jgi:flagellar hook-length control protein FliK
LLGGSDPEREPAAPERQSDAAEGEPSKLRAQNEQPQGKSQGADAAAKPAKSPPGKASKGDKDANAKDKDKNSPDAKDSSKTGSAVTVDAKKTLKDPTTPPDAKTKKGDDAGGASKSDTASPSPQSPAPDCTNTATAAPAAPVTVAVPPPAPAAVPSSATPVAKSVTAVAAPAAVAAQTAAAPATAPEVTVPVATTPVATTPAATATTAAAPATGKPEATTQTAASVKQALTDVKTDAPTKDDAGGTSPAPAPQNNPTDLRQATQDPAQASKASPATQQHPGSKAPDFHIAKPANAGAGRPGPMSAVDAAKAAPDPAPSSNTFSPPPAMSGSALAHTTQAPTASFVPAVPMAAVPISGLAVAIAARANSGKSRFEIRLDPPDLGRIDVRLHVDRDGNVTSRLVVDRSETLDLLRNDAANLQRALQQAGLKTSDNGLQFSLRDQTFSGHDNGSQMQSMARLVVPDDKLPAAELQPTYGRFTRWGGVDIRV